MTPGTGGNGFRTTLPEDVVPLLGMDAREGGSEAMNGGFMEDI